MKMLNNFGPWICARVIGCGLIDLTQTVEMSIMIKCFIHVQMFLPVYRPHPRNLGRVFTVFIYVCAVQNDFKNFKHKCNTS